MISSASIEKNVTALLEMQAEAWNKGDLDKFMTGYLKSKEISYTSGGNEVWGYDAIQARYKNRYGSNKSQMGHLDFSGLKISELGPKNAMCIGRWHLTLDKDSPQNTSARVPEKMDQDSSQKTLQSKGRKIMDGVFTLILAQDARGGWKIIHDHTSLNQKPSDVPAPTQ